MATHVFNINKLKIGGIAISPNLHEVPAMKSAFKWRGDVPFKIEFRGESPFTEKTFESEDKGNNLFETNPIDVNPDTAKVNRAYKFTVTSDKHIVDPIIIIRTIQYFKELAKDGTITSLEECGT